MATKHASKISITLPSEVLAQVDCLASELGVARSALIGSLLADVVPPLIPIAATVRAFNGASSEGESKRYRGEFMGELDSMIKKLNAGFGELQGDMFKPKK